MLVNLIFPLTVYIHSMSTYIRTLSVRVKDCHAGLLRKMASEVNAIFNLTNEITCAAYSNAGEFGAQKPQWLSAFDVQKMTAGIQRKRGWIIGSSTVQEVISYHSKARQQSKRPRLRWRKSHGVRRSLGWVPFKSRAAQWRDGCVLFAGHLFKVWDSYHLENYIFRAGSFAEDSRGRWYFNIFVEISTSISPGTRALGIDLGLKATATDSEGGRLEVGHFYRSLEPVLRKAQRARKKYRIKNIHAKIKNRRKDSLHKYTTGLVNQYVAIFVGDISSKALIQTKLAKSVLDASWTMLKTQLKYKAIARSVVFDIVSERYSTQTCSCCGAISVNSPKGRAGLRIREWTCVECGAIHDRDINAAKNILAAGHCRLGAGNLT